LTFALQRRDSVSYASAMASSRNWSEDEVRSALALYLETPFGKLHSRNPNIVALAEEIGRTPSSVALKLVNLAALDDSLPRKGMSHASATDRRVWETFLSNPATLESGSTYFIPEPSYGHFSEAAGIDKPVQAMRRSGQDLFRKAILTAYRGRCAVTGIDDPRLLNASHIVSWSSSTGDRMNLRNGLCLSALHDRAFDRHLITFDTDWRLLVRKDVPEAARSGLLRGAATHLQMPERFLPDPELMRLHRERFREAA
jgi:putative restriction endonuclease